MPVQLYEKTMNDPAASSGVSEEWGSYPPHLPLVCYIHGSLQTVTKVYLSQDVPGRDRPIPP